MNNERFTLFEQVVTHHYWDLICIVDNELNEGLSIEDVSHLLNDLIEENKKLKYRNEILSDELEQAKAVINKKWSEYLRKKDLI